MIKKLDIYISKYFIKYFLMNIIGFMGVFLLAQTFKIIKYINQGKLVGAPLSKMLETSGVPVSKFDEFNSKEMKEQLKDFDVVITAVGKPGLITSEMLKNKAVVVDAGTASENGKIKGDVAEEVRDFRKDLIITPVKGGVGPLTVASLIDNVIIAARKIADKKGQQDL